MNPLAPSPATDLLAPPASDAAAPGATADQLADRLARVIATSLETPVAALPSALREALRAELEDHLAALHDRLARAERLALAGRMAATVAHELRNPLSVIETSAFVLAERGRDDERVTRHTRRISEQVALAGAVVSDLLESTRVRQLERTAVDVGAMVRDAVAQVARPSAVELSLDLPPSLPRVLADPRRMHQVLTNLLRNALEALGGRGAVAIAAHADAGVVTVTVQDDGPGVDPAHADRLFEPLFTTRRGGTGLGLALSREIVRQHGGELRLEPHAGRGARFAFTLPRADPTRPADAP